MTQRNEREDILDALSDWVRQRSGMDYRNYCSGPYDREGRRAYFAEQRSITKDLHDFRVLLRAVEWRAGIDAEALKQAFSAFAGRLSWDGEQLDYTTGQYFPTEYRKAACAVLACALWAYARPDHEDGESMRKAFRREFGRGIAARWFN